MIIYFSLPSIMLKIGDRFNHSGNLLEAKGYYDKAEADKKLLKRDYSSAIESYEKTLDKDPNNVHSLLMSARLYGFDESLSNYPYTNKEKSKAYYKKLYEITKNKIFLEKF